MTFTYVATPWNNIVSVHCSIAEALIIAETLNLKIIDH